MTPVKQKKPVNPVKPERLKKPVSVPEEVEFASKHFTIADFQRSVYGGDACILDPFFSKLRDPARKAPLQIAVLG